MKNKFKDIKSAYNYLVECTYFAYPIKKNNGDIIGFDNGFMQVLYFYYDENGKCIVEANSFCLKCNTWWATQRGIRENNFEKCLIKLANEVYRKCGEDYYLDYYIYDVEDVQDIFEKQENGVYRYNSEKNKSYWKTKDLLKRIEEFDDM